jgi:hypothetical protein
MQTTGFDIVSGFVRMDLTPGLTGVLTFAAESPPQTIRIAGACSLFHLAAGTTCGAGFPPGTERSGFSEDTAVGRR